MTGSINSIENRKHVESNWTKEGLTQNILESQEFKGRVTFTHDVLKLQKVKSSDVGKYFCSVKHKLSGLSDEIHYNLKIVGKILIIYLLIELRGFDGSKNLFKVCQQNQFCHSSHPNLIPFLFPSRPQVFIQSYSAKFFTNPCSVTR